MNEAVNDYVTKGEFFRAIKDLEIHFDNRFEVVESRLSEKLSNRLNDTYWKIIPIILGLMVFVNTVLFFAVKTLVD